MLSCFDLKTGERIYRERIGSRGGGHSASPIAADGRIYLTSESGDVHIVKAGPKYEHLGVNAMGEYLMATPAISENMLIIRTESYLYGIRN